MRSAHRTARAAERSLQAGLRPVLMPSRPQDPEQKIGFTDQRWLRVSGAGGAAEATEEAVYMVMSLRNVGSGIAVLHGWTFQPDRNRDSAHPPLAAFHRLTRDIYVPPGDVGFWQGAIREPGSEDFVLARESVDARRAMTVDLLYGDHEGGQRAISRFVLEPRSDGSYYVVVARHWNIDRRDPR